LVDNSLKGVVGREFVVHVKGGDGDGGVLENQRSASSSLGSWAASLELKSARAEKSLVELDCVIIATEHEGVRVRTERFPPARGASVEATVGLHIELKKVVLGVFVLGSNVN